MGRLTVWPYYLSQNLQTIILTIKGRIELPLTTFPADVFPLNYFIELSYILFHTSAAGSPTTTLLRLYPNYQLYLINVYPNNTHLLQATKLHITDFLGMTGGVCKNRR